MELTIFSKKRMTREGKTFYAYITRLTKKDGTSVSASVKFREGCPVPRPEDCPRNIIVEKSKASFSTKTYAVQTGEIKDRHTLWVSAWTDGGQYVDTSMDEFM